MNDVLQVMKFCAGCGTLLVLAFIVLLAMPKSKLRAVAMQVVGWAVVVFCVIYGISPFDIAPEALLGPFGLIDDLGAVAVAIGAGRAALQAGRDLQEE